jgi:DNA-binding NtrC family response regulator
MSEEGSEPAATILLVDDEADILTAMRRFLERRLPSIEVVTAHSGPEGLEALAARAMHLVITDYRMPEMDGMEFMAEVARRSPATLRMMMTAYPDMDLAIRAVNEQKVCYFFVKPVEPMELAKAVADALDRARRDRLRDQVLQEADALVKDLWSLAGRSPYEGARDPR